MMHQFQRTCSQHCMLRMNHFITFLLIIGVISLSSQLSFSQELEMVEKVEHQPLKEATKRLVKALQFVGTPLKESELKALNDAYKMDNQKKGILEIQKILDPHCLIGVQINPESRVSVKEGPIKKELIQNGWRTFLIKVHNEAGINPELKVECPNAAPVYRKPTFGAPAEKEEEISKNEIENRFLSLDLEKRAPLKKRLSGLALEYKIIHIYCRDQGKREAEFSFNVGQGTQDIGFRNSVSILFKSLPAIKVLLGVKDSTGKPTTAAFVIRDSQRRIYPHPAKRLAPDFFFHAQIYRADGEHVLLPPGKYQFEVSHGPEYLAQRRVVNIDSTTKPVRVDFRLKRWVYPAGRDWYSGDHHVHAAGCKHYDSPTQGVRPEDMMRHIVGEDLNVGCVLSWGPCWYYQKNFFQGKVSPLSQKNYLMRYDVEVSGFPSSHAGHLCLLGLTEDDYPGTKTIDEWPSWTLPVLKWAKEQHAVVGYSHSGFGLALPDYNAQGKRVPMNPRQRNFSRGKRGHCANQLPDYEVPLFDGIGANEYIVTVAHDLCDFISCVDTPSIWELNIWYHTLNCGFQARISGETDFPCIYGEKIGLGRSYVKLDRDQPLNYQAWLQGLKQGRSYCSDGTSHIFDFKANQVAVGEPGSNKKISQLNLEKPNKVNISFEVAALLPKDISRVARYIRRSRLDQQPYWSLERARLKNSRNVPVEIIVNGYPVARKEIVADGSTHALNFEIDIKHSSWVAVRILPAVHTNPIFIKVDGKPIRASRRSAVWCQQAVDACWNSKKGQIRKPERAEAKQAYQKARKIYEQIEKDSIAE